MRRERGNIEEPRQRQMWNVVRCLERQSRCAVWPSGFFMPERSDAPEQEQSGAETTLCHGSGRASEICLKICEEDVPEKVRKREEECENRPPWV